jgi:hypothetical protein
LIEFQRDKIDDVKEKVGTKSTPKTGAITHSKPDRGLAAFLISDGTRFKVGEPISLSYGVIGVGARSAESEAKPLKVVRPVGAADPNNRSWFSVTGPAGRELAYKGFFVERPAVQPDDLVVLGPDGLVGKSSSDLDLNVGFDLKAPGKYRVRWHYQGGGLEGSWGGKLVSNEIQFEIVP